MMIVLLSEIITVFLLINAPGTLLIKCHGREVLSTWLMKRTNTVNDGHLRIPDKSVLIPAQTEQTD